MPQMALAGALDFSKAKLLDRQWWIKLAVLMNQFEKSNIKQLLTLQHNQHCAAITYSAGEKVLNHHWDESAKLLSKIQKLDFPWWKDDNNKSSTELAIDQMRQQYVAIFGDPASPEVQKGIQQTIAELTK